MKYSHRFDFFDWLPFMLMMKTIYFTNTTTYKNRNQLSRKIVEHFANTLFNQKATKWQKIHELCLHIGNANTPSIVFCKKNSREFSLTRNPSKLMNTRHLKSYFIGAEMLVLGLAIFKIHFVIQVKLKHGIIYELFVLSVKLLFYIYNFLFCCNIMLLPLLF